MYIAMLCEIEAKDTYQEPDRKEWFLAKIDCDVNQLYEASNAIRNLVNRPRLQIKQTLLVNVFDKNLFATIKVDKSKINREVFFIALGESLMVFSDDMLMGLLRKGVITFGDIQPDHMTMRMTPESENIDFTFHVHCGEYYTFESEVIPFSLLKE